jgi:hypothetical protein
LIELLVLCFERGQLALQVGPSALILRQAEDAFQVRIGESFELVGQTHASVAERLAARLQLLG